jgi:aryl-alcohol dehydrogenase-like predicted oxidoreductase
VTLEGRATAAGTAGYAAQFASSAPGHFRQAGDWTLSSIGIGTYLGEEDAATDAGYEEAIRLALASGCNVVDTAVNYRGQRSERVVGRALAGAIAAGDAQRDAAVVATKGGFLTHDSERPAGPRAQIEDMIRAGVMTPADIVAGCHCMTPGYLRHQLGRSRENLDIATIDIYYLHNPETQLQEVERGEFDRRIREAFTVLEEAVAEGAIAVYGAATWTGLRVPPSRPDHLGLADLLRAATDAGGQEHHFRALQLPVNLAMPEAAAAPTQESAGGPVALLQAASDAGLVVMSSGSILQGRLSKGLPAELRTALGSGLGSDAQRALQFTRSTPGVATALVGMSRAGHVRENLALATVPPLDADAWSQLFG